MNIIIFLSYSYIHHHVLFFFFFFFNDTATTEIYTLSLHDALPIFSMSTSTMFQARAETWRLRVMCSAMAFRTTVMGTTSSPPRATAGGGASWGSGTAAGVGTGGVVTGTAAGAADAAEGRSCGPAVSRDTAKARTSFFVIRPPVPV